MFSPENSILLIIDIQGKLARVMHKKDEVARNASLLIQAALILDIPIFITEQAPDKIGATIPEITKHLKHYDPIPKSTFSCCGEQRFIDRLEELKRDEIIVAGIETHVCVYQTVSDLIGKQYRVQVAADAVSSRTEGNKYYGLRRIQSSGGVLTSTEMIICELLKTCKHPKFKDIMSLIK